MAVTGWVNSAAWYWKHPLGGDRHRKWELADALVQAALLEDALGHLHSAYDFLMFALQEVPEHVDASLLMVHTLNLLGLPLATQSSIARLHYEWQNFSETAAALNTTSSNESLPATPLRLLNLLPVKAPPLPVPEVS